MNDLWHRFENWLEQNIPDAIQTLNPGASLEEIEAIQNILKVKLPEEYIAYILRIVPQLRYNYKLYRLLFYL